MKTYYCILLLALPILVFAQKPTFEEYSHNSLRYYDNYKSERQKNYDAYRQKLNTDYAAFMQRRWSEYKTYAAIPKPKDMDAPRPTYKLVDAPASVDEIRYKLIIKLEQYEIPDPIVPIDEPPVDEKPQFKFSFHGTPCAVHLKDEMRFSLADASEKSAGEMWLHLSDSIYDGLIADCLRLRKDLQLSDWGYINLLQTLSHDFYKGKTNETVLMQMYVLTQSGYDVRIARCNDKWILLVPFKANLYGYSYMYMNDLKYYIMDQYEGNSLYTFDRSFPEAQTPSLRMTQSPKFSYRSSNARTLSSRRFPNMKVTITENTNLIDFYNEYPLSWNWDLYSSASFSDETKHTLYPVLKREIAGKTIPQAANMLINFVQTAFNYKTDGEQFGYERPLFGDETIFYPYSDCEDRSIFYSILVRELLGLEVVLLYFPGHLATAVAFPENKTYGTYIRWNGKAYTICDPTYIGADIGECMPSYVNVSPEIIQIQ